MIGDIALVILSLSALYALVYAALAFLRVGAKGDAE